MFYILINFLIYFSQGEYNEQIYEKKMKIHFPQQHLHIISLRTSILYICYFCTYVKSFSETKVSADII